MLTEAFELDARKFAVRNPGLSINEAELAGFEQILGVRLPAQLRSFYLRWNGGLPYPLDVPEHSSLCVRLHRRPGVPAAESGSVGSIGTVQRFNDELEDFIDNWSAFQRWCPADMLCFMPDPGGSQYLIGVGLENQGRIFYWSRWHQPDPDADHVDSLANVADVAGSFADFLQAFRDSHQLPGESEEDWIRRNYGDA